MFKALSLTLIGVLLLTTSADGVEGLPEPRADRALDGGAPPPGPAQRWGSAAGADHLEDGRANRTLPASLRSRYPQHALNQTPAAGRNTASVAQAPAGTLRGFHAKTSQELPAARGAFERTYANVDGTQTTEFSGTPINYRTAGGDWAPIDSTLSGDSGSGWHNVAGPVGVHFAPRVDAPELARLTLDADHTVSYALAGARPAAGRTKGATVTYPNALPHVDVELESQAGGVKETLVLRSAAAHREYAFPLRLTGLRAALVDGQVVLTDANGATRAVFPPGYMVDAAGATSTAVRYDLAGGTLKVTVDGAWLRDPARAYPVRVDPTVSLPVDSGSADSAMYVQGGSSTSGGSDLLVGTVNGTNSASYIRFGSLVSRLQYHTVYGAQLQVVNYDSDSCRARQVTVHPVTSSWTSGGSYSYPGPSVGGSLASRSFAHGYVAFGQSSSACPAAAELFDLGGAGTRLVQRWVNGEQANYGLSLRASADSHSGKKFAGTGTANPPKLFVTHSPYNAAYSIPNPVPNPPVLQNQAGKVSVTVTNKSAAAWAPGGYYLAYRAYNARTGAAVGQQRAANLTASVDRGAKVTLEATIKAMPPGTYFLDFTMVRTGGVVFTDHQVPPGRIVLEVVDIAPVMQELYPPNGYQAPTLTPQLWARALDIDAPPGSALSYKFEVCENTTCFDSGYIASTAWTIPAGKLAWSKSYLWRVFVKDANNEVISPQSTVLTAVPQPELTSRIAGAATAAQEQEFDAQTGNFSTAAVDATVTTVGPELNLVRTYNSLDPRRDGAFGAGWSSRYDMRLVPDEDGSGNVVVTYPDGQQVRFGRNPNGTYAAPSGRTASLTVDGTAWKLTDKSRTVYQFSLNGRLTRITDAALRSIVLTYNTADGRLAKAQVSNSQTNTAGRALTFTWSGGHVATVKADTSTWTYTYTGDLLTGVCAPGNACTTYAYGTGSHYRSAVLDAKPESYWRLSEAQGTAAGSEVAVNLGKDAGTYTNVALGAAGATIGTAATFNGTSSTVELPKGTLKKSRDGAVEVWFKATTTAAGGPLLGYQDKALGSASTTGVPILYVGTDGKLRGQFGGGAIAPLASTAAVIDGRWHHAVLSAIGGAQTLYLDGVKVAEATGRTPEHSLLTFNQIGAAYASTPASWPAWGSTAQRSFAGAIDEVALYSHPLGAAAVAAHYRYATTVANQVTTVTLPSGKVAAEVSYDTGLERVAEYTDRDGGTWKLGEPTVYGSDADLRRGVQVLDPANRPHLYEYDGLTGQLLRSGTPLGLETREEDRPGEPTSPPQPPVEVCSAPDPNDPAFCTVIPGGAGGPVFVRHPLDGMAIRTFQYDDKGNQTVVTNENGDSVTMTHDARGNVVSQKLCRTSTECHTSYTTYPGTVTDPFDPRNDLPTASRDGRSASAADGTYLTTYSYTTAGELAAQTNPDGTSVTHTYTTGGEAAYGGGTMPAGLLLSTTDARSKVSRYAYYANGDLARVTQPSGLATTYTYDGLGRVVTEVEVSDAFPSGVTTTYTYDALSRPATTTEPATTDGITGTRHQQQTVTAYDVDGNVTRVDVKDLLGGDATRTTTWEYDEHNRPIVVTDAEGNETTKSYDRFGNEVSLVDPNGNRYDYAYTARNSLAEVRLRGYAGDGGPTTGDYLVLHSYSYDFAGRMASDTDAMGRRLEYEYYGDDLLRRIVLKNINYVVEENTYDGAGNLIRQAAGNGTTVTQHTYNRVGNVVTTVEDPAGLARTTTYGYDQNGSVTRTTRSGKASNVPWAVSTTPEQVDYAYDDSGNAIRETVTAGTATRVTGYAFDQRGLLKSTTDPRGNVTVYVHDELGRQTVASGPAVAAERDGGAPTTVNPTRRTGYNTFDEPVSAADELGNVGRQAYDRVGRVVTATAPSYWAPGAPAAYNATVQTRYDPAGNVIEVIDPRGNATRYAYDQLGRLVTRDEPASTNDERAVWRYTYTRTGEPLSTTDPTGARAEATYDDLDRQITATTVERRPTAATLTTRYTYDDAGNVTGITSPTGATTVNVYDALGQLTRTTDPNGVAALYGYDFGGRQVRASDAFGRTEQIGYDLFGNVASESDLKPDGTVLRTQTYGYDQAGNMTASTSQVSGTIGYEYDALGRLVKQVEPTTASTSITTTFGYDAAGNRTRYTDGRGNTTTYTYNSWGLVESVVEPGTPAHPNAADRTWTVAYDIGANPARLVAPGGVSRQQTHDAAGRLTAEIGVGAGTPERTLGYDLADRLIRVNAPGGTDTYTYNDRGQLLTAAGPSGAASFGYDGDGNLTARTDAAGSAAYTYTKGRLSAAKDGLTATNQVFGYDTAGQLSTVDYGSGRRRTFTYDDLARVATDTTRNAAGQTVAAVGYRYDTDDRLIGKTTSGTAGAGDNTYGYDLAGRLLSWTSSAGTVTYAWDASGNRTRSGSKTATYDARNRLLSDSDYAYTYTPRGTLATRTSSGLTETYDFDAFDRLVAAAGQAYTYDGLDRVAARNGTAFGYAGLTDDVVSDGTGRYARGPADEVLAVAEGGDKRLALTDEHGDLVGGFDPADATLTGLSESTAYDPFGEVTAGEGGTGDLGYQGDWTDPETEQVDMGARWYAPGTGAFTSRDSVTYSAGDSILANRYTYAAGDPLGNTDPDGYWPSCGWCKKVVKKVSSAAKSTWKGISSAASYAWSGISYAASYAWSGIKRAANWAWSGIKKAAKAVSKAAKWVYNKGKQAVNWVRTKVSQATNWVKNKAAQAREWARKKAEQVRRAIYEAKKRVTQVARRAIEYAAKHNPIRAVAAALKPVVSGLKKVVSAAAHLPAKVLSTVRDVVVDTVKAATVIYQKAVEAAGTVVQNVSAAVDAVVDFAQAAAPVIKAALKVAAEVTGVADLVKCVTKGDLEACAWTAATVAGFALGGVGGGAVRAARASSLAVKHADEAADAVRGVSRFANKADDAADRAEDADDFASCAVGANSFTGDTPVRMAGGGTKPIAEVRVGDRVLATDPTTGRTEAQPVTAVIVGEGEKHLVEVKTDAGAVVATEGHPFWVPSERRWVEAGELVAGQRLGTATVRATRAWTEPARVYNLTVDRIHTYFVVAGGTDLLVHNEDRCPDGVDWDDIDRQLGRVRPEGARAGITPPRNLSRGATHGDTRDRQPDVITRYTSDAPRSKAKFAVFRVFQILRGVIRHGND